MVLTALQRQERIQRFQRLPASLQHAMTSADVARIIGILSEKYGADAQGSTLAEAIGEVFLGILHPNLLIRALSDRCRMPLERARALSFEVSGQIFAPVRTDLMALYGIGSAPSSSPPQPAQPPSRPVPTQNIRSASPPQQQRVPPAPSPLSQTPSPPMRPVSPPPRVAPPLQTMRPSSPPPPPQKTAPPRHLFPQQPQTPRPAPERTPPRPPITPPPPPPEQSLRGNTVDLRKEPQ